MGNPSIDNLDPRLRDIALRIVAESGGRVTIGSGWRSNQKQTELYNAWKSGNYDVPVVAVPGTSKHEHGLAIDFGGDLRLAQELGRKYGLIFPVEGEAWHAQLGEGVQGGGQPGTEYGVQYDLNYTGTDQQENPEDVLANRVHAINRILGLDMTSAARGPMPIGNDVMEMAPEAISPAEVPEAGPRMDQAQQMVPAVTGATGGNPEDVQFGMQDATGFGQYAAAQFQKYGWDTAKELPALIWLWNKESGNPAERNKVTWNPLAQNPTSTAFGIAQFLNGTWAGTGIAKTTNPNKQIDAGLIYIASRYGSPSAALQFHLNNNWY
jgi:hypothetical protein